MGLIRRRDSGFELEARFAYYVDPRAGYTEVVLGTGSFR